MLELNQCYRMDCMEGMAQFPDQYFDLAVVDPPYFSGPERRGYYGRRDGGTLGKRNEYHIAADAWKVPDERYFQELRRVSKRYIMQGDKRKNEKRIHPTQKPVILYDWIFGKYALPGYKVLDTHLGSGSSRIAAYKAGLDFVGFEIDPANFEAEEQRFAEFAAQLSLFLGGAK